MSGGTPFWSDTDTATDTGHLGLIPTKGHLMSITAVRHSPRDHVRAATTRPATEVSPLDTDAGSPALSLV